MNWRSNGNEWQWLADGDMVERWKLEWRTTCSLQLCVSMGSSVQDSIQPGTLVQGIRGGERRGIAPVVPNFEIMKINQEPRITLN